VGEFSPSDVRIAWDPEGISGTHVSGFQLFVLGQFLSQKKKKSCEKRDDIVFVSR